jgi:hypothetical protein
MKREADLRLALVRRAIWLIGLTLAFGLSAVGQSGATAPATPGATVSATTGQPKSAAALYAQLRTVGLDKKRVYQARDVSFNRDAIQISLDDGTIAFTEDVAGRVTGAFFQGDGEVLLMPPNQVERASMALFTGSAILEEKFVTAYFRFNDDTYEELKPQLRPADQGEEFATQWNETARNMASVDALRLLMSFSRLLPLGGQSPAGQAETSTRPVVAAAAPSDRWLRVHVQGRHLGGFDLSFDSAAAEQVRAGQLKTVQSDSYYDMWTSFSTKTAHPAGGDADSALGEESVSNAISISNYKIRTEVKPPTELDAEATLQVEVHQGGQRALLFELSRFLEIKQVEADGQRAEFIQNPALEGTQLARRGDDLVAVVFPQPLRTGERIELHFAYRGEVLSEAGPGLLYVGARGIWYPNFGLAESNFDLEFRYPAGWTLVATGARREDADLAHGNDAKAGIAHGDPREQIARWVSERPMPFAGFNLGKYTRAVAHAGSVAVEAYATSGMEREFPQPSVAVKPAIPGLIRLPRDPQVVTPPPPPSPARNEQSVADESARAVDFFSRRFGPYPYGKLALTQMPGKVSQGWPGLIFLSSFAFLSSQQRAELHLSSVDSTLTHGVIAHETAHQWWGDLVGWKSYRDQWIVEALSEYSSLMLLESGSAGDFRAVMDNYRDNLLVKNNDGVPLKDAGPVTLGVRLSCSHFPAGYEAISYGRGVWLLHMLRTMMRDADAKRRGSGSSGREAPEEPFIRALRKVREQYEGKSISTAALLRAFEEELPPSLWYEGRKSLDWFEQGWINGTAIPRLQLRGVKYVDGKSSTTISGTILQSDAPEDLVTSVSLYAAVAGKSVLLGRVFADGGETGFHLTAPMGARKVVLDPNRTVLAQTR